MWMNFVLLMYLYQGKLRMIMAAQLYYLFEGERIFVQNRIALETYPLFAIPAGWDEEKVKRLHDSGIFEGKGTMYKDDEFGNPRALTL